MMTERKSRSKKVQIKEVSDMNEELDYAEMLEIPVETVTVKRKEHKRKGRETDLQQQLLEQVNDRMEEPDPTFAESTQIVREAKPVKKHSKLARRVIVGEFVLVCLLCAAIFLTNIFVPESAINTFVRGLFQGDTAAAAADNRVYTDFSLSPVVNEYTDAEIAVSELGVLSFTAECSVYAPCEGTVKSISGDAATGYTLELKHSDNFSTIMSGLDTVYLGVGDKARTTLPLGHSDGEGEVRVMFYAGTTLITNCTVNGAELAWS